MLGRINNGIVELVLPESGIMADGRTVSNYCKLPLSALRDEGWKDCTESIPDYDPKTEISCIDNVVESDEKIVVTYRIEPIGKSPYEELLDAVLADGGVI